MAFRLFESKAGLAMTTVSGTGFSGSLLILQNPEYTEHRFRFELDTDSGTDWTVNPIWSGQQIQF